MEQQKHKTYADCYLYNKYPKYNSILYEAMMCDDFIDKGEKNFNDIVYEIKRTRINDHLMQVLNSPKTILFFPPTRLPKPFVTFVAKDPRSKTKELKLFIDCTNCISKDKGGYYVNDSRLVSYLVAGYFNMKYAVQGIGVLPNGSIREYAAICFSSLFTYIIDYLAKISIVDGAKDKCIYLAARYFLDGICRIDDTRSKEIARHIAGITEIKETTYSFHLKPDDFEDIRSFTKLIKETFKIKNLTVDILVEKWMYLFGPGTVFALEYLPAFISMMTDAYIGAFINNQKTIEKICSKSMVKFAKDMIDSI